MNLIKTQVSKNTSTSSLHWRILGLGIPAEISPGIVSRHVLSYGHSIPRNCYPMDIVSREKISRAFSIPEPDRIVFTIFLPSVIYIKESPKIKRNPKFCKFSLSNRINFRDTKSPGYLGQGYDVPMSFFSRGYDIRGYLGRDT